MIAVARLSLRLGARESGNLNSVQSMNVCARPRDTDAIVGKLFPQIGPATQFTLFGDIGKTGRPTEDDWLEEVNIIAQHRLGGTALRVASQFGSTLPEAVTQHLRTAQFAWVERSIDALKGAAVAIDVLETQGIGTLVTKGPGLAKAHGSLWERPFSDVDILVSRKSYRAAERALQREGFTGNPKTPLPWKAFSLICVEARNLDRDGGSRIDLHHHVPPWLWGVGLTYESLYQRASTSCDLAPGMRVVSDIDNLLISALHIVSDHDRPGKTLMAWRDVLVLSERCNPRAVVDAAAAVNAAGWLHWILSSLPPTVRPEPLLDALRPFAGRIPYKHRLNLLVTRPLLAEHPLGRLLRIPARNGLFYVAGLAVPSPAFFRDKFPDLTTPYRTFWRTTIRDTIDQIRSRR